MSEKNNKSSIQITVRRVFYGEKYGGDDVHAEIYLDNILVGKVFRNGYLKEIRGCDLRVNELNRNDERAYYYPNKELDFNEQLDDAIVNTAFIIGKNNHLLPEYEKELDIIDTRNDSYSFKFISRKEIKKNGRKNS